MFLGELKVGVADVGELADRRRRELTYVSTEWAGGPLARICRPLLEAGVNDEEGEPDKEELFWIRATLVEALTGVGSAARDRGVCGAQSP